MNENDDSDDRPVVEPAPLEVLAADGSADGTTAGAVAGAAVGDAAACAANKSCTEAPETVNHNNQRTTRPQAD